MHTIQEIILYKRNASLVITGLVVAVSLGWIFIAWVVNNEGTGFKGQDLFEWFELLLVPIVLGLAAVSVNWLLQKQQGKLAREENKTDREIAIDRNDELTLRHYQDVMRELILSKRLGADYMPNPHSAVIASAQTIVALRSLDPARRSVIVRFLQESNLIGGDPPTVTLSTIDLSGADLHDVNLRGTDIKEANLVNTNLRGANLSGSYLNGADLSGADLTGAILTKANLTGAILTRAILKGADLTGANLTGAILQESNLVDTNLSSATLKGVVLEGAVILDTDMSSAIFGTTDFSGLYMSRPNFQKARLSGVNFSGAILSRPNFTETGLSRKNFAGAALISPNFENARLANAKFNGLHLYRANFTNANLSAAQMEGSDLSGSTLSHASLTNTNLKGALLRDADLTNADFSTALLENADLTGASRDKTTTLSDNQLRVSRAIPDFHRPIGVKNQRLGFSYLYVRRSVGYLNLMVPLVVLIWGFIACDCGDISTSLTAYPANDSWFGMMITTVLTGALLITYRGYSLSDDITYKIVALSALTIGMLSGTSNDTLTTIYATALAIYFITMAYILIRLFTRHSGAMSPNKILRNRIYLICGITIILALVAIASINTFASDNKEIAAYNPILWLEWIMFWAIGIAWLVKGETVARDRWGDK
jgi:uncharacterized protein YjbI with pentapeptide repeats